ncbi:MAG: prephenate dehydrogenase/arogenate dehydrogenase family protein, partial [Ilumatobacteraceae bacterium]
MVSQNSPAQTANVVGLGLIGGSIALALGEQGWAVCGVDSDVTRQDLAVERGVIDRIGLDPDAAVTFVAVPPKAMTTAVADALATTRGVVTDQGSVKAAVCAD